MSLSWEKYRTDNLGVNKNKMLQFFCVMTLFDFYVIETMKRIILNVFRLKAADHQIKFGFDEEKIKHATSKCFEGLWS